MTGDDMAHIRGCLYAVAFVLVWILQLWVGVSGSASNWAHSG
jgi:hypothetical protein